MEGPRSRSCIAGRLRRLLRQPRLLLALLVGVVTYAVLPAGLPVAERPILAFNAAAAFFLAAIALLARQSTPATMRQRSATETEGRHLVLILGTLVACGALAGVVLQLHGLKDHPTSAAGAHVALTAATIFLAWGFMNALFAIHYAHAYYRPGNGAADGIAQGLVFPGSDRPDYWDFLYFAFVLGMTFQTADVQIAGGAMRRAALAHGLLAFLFNVVILALTINILAGLV